jgi:hypothetical protein
MTVKAYPHPSETYREIVCSAGIDERGEMIRLYPFPFRFMDSCSQFSKYQWIDVEIEKSTKDPRPESYKAYPDSVRLLDKIEGWKERRELVLARNLRTMCELTKNAGRTKVSLAVVKPSAVLDLKIMPCDRQWSAKDEESLRNLWLIECNRPELRKLPYKFLYRYKCSDPQCRGHEQMIEDWEIGALYWRLIDGGDSEEIAISKVKYKFYEEMCSEKRDMHFFVGTHSSFPSWMIVGTFSPPNLYPTERKGQKTLWSC